jgi:hypothetical protein
LYSQHKLHDMESEKNRKDISDLASMNARLDIFRASMYSYGYGIGNAEIEDLFREEMSKYGIIPVNLGCELIATDYTLSYNSVIREHLLQTHGKDPIHEFLQTQKANSGTQKEAQQAAPRNR